jgi:superfamily I DNA/RNA helicase
MARVEELADRKEGEKSARWRPYVNLIPLPEIIGEANDQGVNSKGVTTKFEKMLTALGNELFILQDAPLADIERAGGTLIAEGIRRMRSGEVNIAAGYDGEYGTIKLFSADDRKKLAGQTSFVQPVEAPRADEAEHDMSAAAKPLRVMDRADLASAESSNAATKKFKASILSTSQDAAVHHTGSHLLIVAGPGSGKTHTLVHRIAHFAKTSAANETLLSITFTNKAAEELRQRLEKLSAERLSKIFTGTFHSFCLNLLREYAEALSLPSDFAIISESEKEELAGLLWPQLSATERGSLLEKISLLKSNLDDQNKDLSVDEARRELDAAMREQQKLDFDDLLLEAVQLLKSSSQIRDEIQKRHSLIFVDEYQDINAAQHALLKLLVGEKSSITAIGDPNQSIYGFRGSRPEFFHSFANDFPGAAILSLEENYRSATTLLSAAGQVIAAAPSKFATPLSPTVLAKGRLFIHHAPTENAEAECVVHQIEKIVGGTSMFSQDSGRVGYQHKGERSFGDIAVLYRLNALTEPLQEALDRAGMPYQISGEMPLIDRVGVRALVTALRLAAKLPPTTEDIAQLMLFTVRGFGRQAYAKLEKALQDEEEVTIESMRTLAQKSLSSGQHRQNVTDFCQELNHAAVVLTENGVAAAIEFLISSTSYFLNQESPRRLEDLFHRVLYLAHRHDTLQDFFAALLLQRDHDDFEYHSEKISLLTLHAAKGLEFNVVFIIGCEENLLPLSLPGFLTDAEEERRLFYVGMTRAKEQLFLVRAGRRMLFGKSQENPPSPFLNDIEEQLKEYEAWQASARRTPSKAGQDQLKLF